MSKQRLLQATIVSVLSAGIAGAGISPLFAADSAAQDTAAASAASAESDAQTEADATADKALLKVSEDARLTMRDLRGARLAIFDGKPDEARTLVDASQKRAEAAVQDASHYASETKQPMTDDRYVPFDVSLAVADVLELSPEEAQHIEKANADLHKGENQEAMGVLDLDEIDVAVTAGLVPVRFAKEHIDDAADLIEQGKYYEANLALKAVEDAVVVETLVIDAAPKATPESAG